MSGISQTDFEKKVLKALRGDRETKLEILSIIVDALRRDPLVRDEIIRIVRDELDQRQR